MKKRKQRSRAFWLELIRRFESTPNITQKQFALQNDVTLASFQSWLYIFRKQGLLSKSDTTASVSFIELPHPASSNQTSNPATLFFPNDLILEFSALPQHAFVFSYEAANDRV